MKSRTYKGFTLIELIVVIAIIGILMAMLVPNLVSYVTDARVITANSAAQQVYINATNFVTKAVITGVPAPNDTAVGSYVAAKDSPDEHLPGETSFDWDKFFNSMDYYLGELADGSFYQVYFNEQGYVAAAAWSKNTKDTVIGTYPKMRTSGDIQDRVFITEIRVGDYTA